MKTDSFIRLDLHGKTLYQARVTLDAALRRSKGAYRICVIHGESHGHAIRDMLMAEYAVHPLVLRLENGSPGRTELVLREL